MGKRTSAGPPSAALPPLSPRQYQVLQLMASGLGNKEIATRLTIATPTVNQHVQTLLLKFRVANRTELVATALRSRLLH